MPAVIKELDIITESEFNPTFVRNNNSTGFTSSVFINGIGVVCKGDQYESHSTSSTTPKVTHGVSKAGSSGSKVFVGLPASERELFTAGSESSNGCGASPGVPPGSTVFAGEG